MREIRLPFRPLRAVLFEELERESIARDWLLTVVIVGAATVLLLGAVCGWG